MVLKLCNLLFIVDTATPTRLRLRQIGTKIKASWRAPTNPVVDYRVFINNENVNSNGRIVASALTTYITNTTFSILSTVRVHIRATTKHYWSPEDTTLITIYGNFNIK